MTVKLWRNLSTRLRRLLPCLLVAVSLPVSAGGEKDFDSIDDGDVVILPAFGASLEEMQTLDNKNVQVVDTTCPWVSKVWNTVDKHTKVRCSKLVLAVHARTLQMTHAGRGRVPGARMMAAFPALPRMMPELEVLHLPSVHFSCRHEGIL